MVTNLYDALARYHHRVDVRLSVSSRCGDCFNLCVLVLSVTLVKHLLHLTEDVSALRLGAAARRAADGLLGGEGRGGHSV